METQPGSGVVNGKERAWVMTGLVAGGLAGLAAFVWVTGCSSVPSRMEQRFYDIDTNLVPRVVWVTNVVREGEFQGARAAGPTNAAKLTDSGAAVADGLPSHLQDERSSRRGDPTYVALATNYDEVYTYTPNERAQAVAAVAGGAAGLLGPVGELVAVLCAGAFGVWGQLRSSRATKVAGVLAQVIETGRTVLQSTPQGQELDERWKSWMIKHQAEQGVIEDVVKLLGSVVDSASAKEAADKLLGMMGERKG